MTDHVPAPVVDGDLRQAMDHAVRRVRIGPFGPNARDQIMVGGTVNMTPRESDEIIANLLPVVTAHVEREVGERMADEHEHRQNLLTKVIDLGQALETETARREDAEDEKATHAAAEVEAVAGPLRRLVALKDGPRDEHYRETKDAAWADARAALPAQPADQAQETGR